MLKSAVGPYQLYWLKNYCLVLGKTQSHPHNEAQLEVQSTWSSGPSGSAVMS